jgi:dipeptidyl-peptidase-4
MLTIDLLYDPKKKVNFDGTIPADVTWLKDGVHYLYRKTDPESEKTEWIKVHAATGESAPLFDAAKLEYPTRCTINPNGTALLFVHNNDLFYSRIGDDPVRLMGGADSIIAEQFSPDGRMVSFVRDYDLWVVDIDTRRERELTAGGSEMLLNGRLDWVYQEEIYGRGSFKGYWWSPDSESIAFLSLDESDVKQHTIIDHVPGHAVLEVMNYPKAGEPNPRVRLGIVNTLLGKMRWIDTSRYESGEFLIVRVGWTPDSLHIVYQIQDREQRWLDLVVGSKTIVEERSSTWVGVAGEPHWLKDGSFLWLSERTGWKHLYHYSDDGKLIRAVTSGEWDVRILHGVDETSGLIYFSGTKDSAVANHTYRVHLNGTALTRLTETAGTHKSVFNPRFTQFIDYWSDIQTPTQLRLFTAAGSEQRVIDPNPVGALKQYDLGKPELLQVKTRDGFSMEALMIRPPAFDPSHKYPVLVNTYGGPYHPQVQNAWGGVTYLWHQMLAQMGYIIWVCDNRTASGKGIQSAWPMYRNAGELELRDIEDGLDWLCGHDFVDPERIGIWGWSYGGFMTSYALTHSRRFKIGIAGAPVTDWHNYDTVYTERYMALPQNNPEGYEKSSPLKAAANLQGKLLLIHGATDDNVLMQNTIQFLYELQNAGKKVELMIYPRSRHHVSEPLLVKHLRTLMTDFIVLNL